MNEDTGCLFLIGVMFLALAAGMTYGWAAAFGTFGAGIIGVIFLALLIAAVRS